MVLASGIFAPPTRVKSRYANGAHFALKHDIAPVGMCLKINKRSTTSAGVPSRPRLLGKDASGALIARLKEVTLPALGRLLRKHKTSLMQRRLLETGGCHRSNELFLDLLLNHLKPPFGANRPTLEMFNLGL
jgi:hypothetical protein